MAIADFFKEKENSVTREKLFLNKIMFDLKLAAAHAEVPLQIFTPDVDRDGYDIIVDDADAERRFQLKSVLASSTTASWDIYKRLLRPTVYNVHALGFAMSPEGVGIEGGVILIHIDDGNPDCPVVYSYTDVFILTAMANGLLVPSQVNRTNQAHSVLAGLHEGSGRDSIRLPKGIFVKLRSPSALLSIGGFHNSENSYCWFGNLLAALQGNFRVDETPQSIDLIRSDL